MEMEPEKEQEQDQAVDVDSSEDGHDREHAEQSQSPELELELEVQGKNKRKRKAKEIEIIDEDKAIDTAIDTVIDTDTVVCIHVHVGENADAEDAPGTTGEGEEREATSMENSTCKKKHKENTTRDVINMNTLTFTSSGETGDNAEEKEETAAEEEKEKEATTTSTAPAVPAVQPAIPLPLPQQCMMMQQQQRQQQVHVAMRQTQAPMMQRARDSMTTDVQLQQAPLAIPLGVTSVPIQQHLQILAFQKQTAAAMAKHQYDFILRLKQTNEKHKTELKKVQEELAEFRSEQLDRTKAKAKETKALQAEIGRGKKRILKLEQRLQQEKQQHTSTKRQLKNKKGCKSARMFNSNTQLMHPNSDSASGNKHDLKWQAQYDQLTLFKQQYGHTTVSKDNPNHQDQFPGLSNWVRTQRSSWANLREGKRTFLTPHRIHLMKQIGFDWHPRGRDMLTFQERLQQLTKYKTARGDCNVPQKYNEEPGLGGWVLHIRRMYLNDKLDDNRIAALEELGFQWRMRAVRGSRG